MVISYYLCNLWSLWLKSAKFLSDMYKQMHWHTYAYITLWKPCDLSKTSQSNSKEDQSLCNAVLDQSWWNRVMLNQCLQHTSDVVLTKQCGSYVTDVGSSQTYVRDFDLTFCLHHVNSNFTIPGKGGVVTRKIVSTYPRYAWTSCNVLTSIRWN